MEDPVARSLKPVNHLIVLELLEQDFSNSLEEINTDVKAVGSQYS